MNEESKTVIVFCSFIGQFKEKYIDETVSFFLKVWNPSEYGHFNSNKTIENK